MKDQENQIVGIRISYFDSNDGFQNKLEGENIENPNNSKLENPDNHEVTDSNSPSSHSEEEEKIHDSEFFCESSNSSTTTRKKPKRQKKDFICAFDNCGKKFEYKWILDRHINSHFCFKLFKCDYKDCSKAYKSKENLNLHIKNKHLGQKPYKCSFCDSRFSHRNGKTYHERKVHIKFLPHQCNLYECGVSFASKSALNYHIANQH